MLTVNGCVFSAYLVWYILVLFPCASLTHMCVPCGGSLVGLVDSFLVQCKPVNGFAGLAGLSGPNQPCVFNAPVAWLVLV